MGGGRPKCMAREGLESPHNGCRVLSTKRGDRKDAALKWMSGRMIAVAPPPRVPPPAPSRNNGHFRGEQSGAKQPAGKQLPSWV